MNTKTNTEGIELKVLVLEDSTRDLELMREQLSNAGYHLDLTHVDNETGFTAALRENSFDLILADFKLPGFDGFGALQISRELCPETPFICVSGTIGEEIAVELLKLGAVDYVLKDRPDRLPFAVKRALEEAEVKADYQKAAEALRESEEKFRYIAENAIECIWLMDLKLKFTYISPSIYPVFGFTQEEWIGSRLSQHCTLKEFFKMARKALSAARNYHKSDHLNFEAEMLKKDGTPILVEIIGKLRFNENGLPAGFHGSTRDITERKQAEKIKQLQYNIARATITTRNLNELFDSVKNELNSIIDVKNLFIALYDEETGMVHSPLFKDEKDDYREWPAEKTLTGYVIKQNRPVLLKKKEILRLHEEGIIELNGTISEVWLGVPLKVEGKMLGAIVVQNYDNPDVYDQTSIEIMELVAHELSIFIDRQH
ncbi:MAG: PAS domain S-box protein, partial [Bacteroidales bacterium]|nr:PAS domain S-box protein [Bacteroidales bacterium]